MIVDTEKVLREGARRSQARFKVTSSIVTILILEFNYVPKDKTFPVPLEYIDVTRTMDVARKTY